MIEFNHLHSHSTFSLIDSLATVDALFKTAKEMGQKAIAITEHGNNASVWDCRKAAKKYGVQYIAGLEAYFCDTVEDPKSKRQHLVLLAKNQQGYKNLLKLNYLGFQKHQYVPFLNKVFSRIDWSMLEQYHDGLICSTACPSGLLAFELIKYNEGNEWNKEACYQEAIKVAKRLQALFGEDLFLELQPHALKKFKTNRKSGEVERDVNGEPIVTVDQHYVNSRLITMARELNLPLVATCDVHYIKKEDALTHDLLMSVNDKKPLSDPHRHRYEVEEFYMKSGDEVFNYLQAAFDGGVALEACSNTVRIAERCEDTSYIDSNVIRFPKFKPAEEKDYDTFLKWREKNVGVDIAEDNAYLRYRCIKAFNERFSGLGVEEKKEYKQRMIDEIKVFESKQFSSYMLIVADFICKAKEHGIRIGPGRGSVSSSLAAYLLGIHELDPIEYGLIFARFMNKEKVAFPDIDTDISPDGRGWVEDYITNKYGKDKVAHVSNLSRMTPKVVIKDLARSLEIGGGRSEAFKIANEITEEVANDAKTFDDALKSSKRLRDFCVEHPEIELHARKLIGLEKSYATHAAGIVISDVDLSTFVPLRYDKDGQVAVQYEKERCEAVGLIKMDLLGLEHLNIIDNTIKNARSLGLECPETESLYPFDDKVVWSMISSGKTKCVFEMSSQHMSALCKHIKPTNVEELGLVNALGRPSADKSRQIYVNRRNGKEKVVYDYECLRKPLEDTLGVCVYEEQLAKVAAHVAGWSLYKADGLRKLTKLKGKDPQLAKRLEEDFVVDAMKVSGLKQAEAADLWKTQIEPFAGYGFNASHAIAYSINGYHSAYYKLHYPAPFMAAVLSSEVEKVTKDDSAVKEYKKEAELMGLKIVSPNINKSDRYYSVLDTQTIAMGLAAIKGVGGKAIDEIIRARTEHTFTCFADFLYRTSSKLVRKDIIQALAKAGCLDSLGVSRRAAYELYADVRTKAAKYMDKNGCGERGWEVIEEFEYDYGMGEWDRKELLNGEIEVLGECLSGNLNELYNGFFTGVGIDTLSRVKSKPDGAFVTIEVLLDKVESMKTKSGKNKGNEYGSVSVVDINKDTAVMKVWSDRWGKVKDKLIAGRPMRAVCKVNVWQETHSLVLERIQALG